jgi:hypothetical protein
MNLKFKKRYKNILHFVFFVMMKKLRLYFDVFKHSAEIQQNLIPTIITCYMVSYKLFLLNFV